MPIELKMPALSPTMEEGSLAKWLVKEGDVVKSGDLLAEIETDKATMEFEAVDEGIIAKILIPEGTEGVKIGTVVAMLAAEGEDITAIGEGAVPALLPAPEIADKVATSIPAAVPVASSAAPAIGASRIKASPLARRLAEASAIDLSTIRGSGPNGRIVKVDIDGATPASMPAVAPGVPAAFAAAVPSIEPDIPHEVVKLSNMRKVIARRLTESKQQVPHIYLTADIHLDPLLKLRADLNDGLAERGVKLSVNDLLVKALAAALIEVPSCNVQFTGDNLLRFSRVDISVAVSIPGGLITPIIAGANAKGVAAISSEMKDRAERARNGKLQPHEYQGGTASLSNMGMFGIKQFEAVINPPQAMIMAIGAGEKRPYVVNNALTVATVMSVTGSFDHRAIDGADGAQLMAAFKRIVEKPLTLLA